MNAYALSHDLQGERQRLALMSELLDPTERRNIRQLGLAPGWRCLEVGCGNGSIARWLAIQVGHGGHVQRLSPPDPSAASIAAITRSVIAPPVFTNAATAFGTT